MGMSAELRNSCQYQSTKIDDAIPTSNNKPDEFIFCFNSTCLTYELFNKLEFIS